MAEMVVPFGVDDESSKTCWSVATTSHRVLGVSDALWMSWAMAVADESCGPGLPHRLKVQVRGSMADGVNSISTTARSR